MEGVALQRWLQRLYQLHPHEIELGLERVAEVATRLQLLPLACPVVVVAGTNGKGTTVAALQALALAHGRTVGCYTSPHLLHFNERICVNGKALDDADICAAFEQIESLRQTTALTFFEYTTLAALLCFKQRQLDLVVLEVGLGGRLDAVNIVNADIAIITSIELDHMDWLGDTVEQIAGEKAGIIRSGKPLVLASATVPASLQQAAVSASKVYQRDREFGWLAASGAKHWYGEIASGQRCEIKVHNNAGLPEQSIAAAIQAWALLDFGFKPARVAVALAALAVPGRNQFISWQGKRLLLDVAHNPAAAKRLGQVLASRREPGQIHVILGMMADKDCQGFIAQLAPAISGRWAICGLDTSRAFTPTALAAILTGMGYHADVVANTVAEALDQVFAGLPEQDLLVVCGSFYTVAGVLALIEKGTGIER